MADCCRNGRMSQDKSVVIVHASLIDGLVQDCISNGVTAVLH